MLDARSSMLNAQSSMLKAQSSMLLTKADCHLGGLSHGFHYREVC